MGVEAYHALQVRVGVRVSVIDLKTPQAEDRLRKRSFCGRVGRGDIACQPWGHYLGKTKGYTPLSCVMEGKVVGVGCPASVHFKLLATC